ncbi:hypothetical protein PPUJ20028_22100 [Pseudomonas putida]|uniref:DUF6680 domain-containing protein n=2 Tax=Pseudomonas putida TaxID=303 RepID=A0AA37VLY9_PSEPU|nr:hypothetical protein PPUJ20028_22100 [Pseudomonas putida]GLO33406.1 hypothetical protein PPUN14671_02390 [Pseudomonas putida]
MRIFSTLMATRAARMSPDHVQALNMIDLAFNGGSRTRRRSETDVLDAWRDYLDHLTSAIGDAERWHDRQGELFIILLSSMASDLGLRYDRVLLRNGAYMPKGHTDIEEEQLQARRLLLEVLSGRQAVSMNVTGLPIDPDFAQSQRDVQDALAKALCGEGALRVAFDVPQNSSQNLVTADEAPLDLRSNQAG